MRGGGLETQNIPSNSMESDRFGSVGMTEGIIINGRTAALTRFKQRICDRPEILG